MKISSNDGHKWYLEKFAIIVMCLFRRGSQSGIAESKSGYVYAIFIDNISKVILLNSPPKPSYPLHSHSTAQGCLFLHRYIMHCIGQLGIFFFCHFDGWEIISHYNLNFHFSYCINKLEQLFMCLQVICISFSEYFLFIEPLLL